MYLLRTSQRRNRSEYPQQHGSTLIEVLVAIIVLSLGLLGIAGLQAATTKYKVNTWARSAATHLLSDFSERVRINPEAGGSNFTTGINAEPLYRLTSSWATQQAEALSVSKKCEALETKCTSDERAAYDMTSWRQRVRAGLPQGAAIVSGDRKSGFEVTLLWLDKDATDKGQSASSELLKPTICQGDETGLAQQTCCPSQAKVSEVAGVRCARFSFVP